MAINPILFKTPKAPLSRINVVGKVDDYVNEMVFKEFGSEIEKTADMFKRNVNIAQRQHKNRNVLYVNSGNLTSHLDMNAMTNPKQILNTIIENIRANSIASKGLDAAKKLFEQHKTMV